MSSRGGSRDRAILGRVFLVLAVSFALLAAIEWFAWLEPRLRSETRTAATAVAHAQGFAVQQHLARLDVQPPVDSLRDTLSEMLLLTDAETGSPFFAGFSMVFSEPWAEHSLDVGDTRCPACFVDRIPLYARDSGELIAKLIVRSNPDFYQQMRADTRRSLVAWFFGLSLLLFAGWRVLLNYERHSEQTEAQAGAVFAASPVPLLLVDREHGGLRRHNAAAEQLLGARRVEDADCDALFGRAVARRLISAGSNPASIEIQVEVGGRSVPLIATVTPLPAQRDLLIVGLVDISERKAMEQSLAAEKADADTASKAKSSFLAAMSHEIRTPLNGIIGFAQVLGDSALSNEQREHLDLIELSARNLLGIIEEILDFSRIEAGKLAIRLAPANLPGMLDETVRLFRNKAEEKGLELIYRADPKLPLTMETDALRLRQVLGILIDNAIKFTPRGGLELDTVCEGGQLKIAVADTGIGVPAEEIERLFEPFYQVDRGVKRRFGGTGLGLVIARNIVAELDGEIQVESTPGQGSCFTIVLPLRGVADAPLAGDDGSPPTRWYSTRGGRVLVVDDDPVNGHLLVYLLESRGLQADRVESGEDALDCLEDTTYNLVFLDWFMPGFGGLDVLEALKERRKRTGRVFPGIVVTTADARKEHVGDLGSDAVADILAKPIDTGRLDEVLRRHLGQD